jgi:hypothetical protein
MRNAPGAVRALRALRMREWQMGGGRCCPSCGQIMEERAAYWVCWNVVCDVVRVDALGHVHYRDQVNV